MIGSPTFEAKILIVDDKLSNIEVLEELIEESGYRNYKYTTDSRQVIELFRSYEPDIILLDLMMPYLDGYEIMSQLSNLIPATTYFPILVLTADFSPESKRKALSMGAKDFLSKPFDLFEVRLRIKNLLETRFLYQQLEKQNLILEQKVKERTFELENVNLALDQANKELGVLDKAKSDFLCLISHEIRTPLNGIKGFTSILKQEIANPELLEYLDYLETSAIRLENFSYQALLITELHSGKYKVRPQSIPLGELINQSITKQKIRIDEKRLTIAVNQEEPISLVTADPRLLGICFERLLDNSVKYSPVDAMLQLNIISDADATIIEFVDAGNGFPQKILLNPFMVFGLGEEHVDRNTGLNLALIKLIMDAHHGRIEISNNPKGGAKVKLTFTNQS